MIGTSMKRARETLLQGHFFIGLLFYARDTSLIKMRIKGTREVTQKIYVVRLIAWAVFFPTNRLVVECTTFVNAGE